MTAASPTSTSNITCPACISVAPHMFVSDRRAIVQEEEGGRDLDLGTMRRGLPPDFTECRRAERLREETVPRTGRFSRWLRAARNLIRNAGELAVQLRPDLAESDRDNE